MKTIVLLLVAVAALVAVPVSVIAATSDVSHQRLEKILKLPEYHRWESHHGYRAASHNAVLRVLDRISRYLNRLVAPLLRWLRWKMRGKPHNHSHQNGHHKGASGAWGLGSLAGVLGKILLSVLALAVIALVGWILWSLWKRQRAPVASAVVRSSAINVKKALDEGDALAQGADAWLTVAHQLGQDGNWRLAYRAMYLALLSGLHQSGRINFRRSLTNHAYVNGYRGPKEEIQTFSTLTDIFDCVWYGQKTIPTETLAGIEAQLKSLLNSSVTHG